MHILLDGPVIINSPTPLLSCELSSLRGEVTILTPFHFLSSKKTFKNLANKSVNRYFQPLFGEINSLNLIQFRQNQKLNRSDEMESVAEENLGKSNK